MPGRYSRESVSDIVARVRLELDQASAVRASMQAQQALRRVGTTSNATGRQVTFLNSALRTLAGTLFRATAVAATFFGMRAVSRFVSTSIEEFAALDKQVTDSASLLGKTGLMFKTAFSNISKDIGKAFNFEFTEVAESIQHLISAGFDAQQSMKTLPVVAEFAKAGGLSLKTSVDFLSDSMHALGMNVKDPLELMQNMARVSDVLSKANNISNATVEEFAESLTNKAAAAMRMFNIDVEEGAAVLAAFASQGKKGQTAGEYFDIFLREVTRTATRSKEAFKQWGIEVFDEQGNVRNLADVVDSLSGAFAGLSDQQQVQALMQLGFTFRSIQTIKALMGTGAAIRAYEKDLRAASGTTKEMSDIRLTSFSERWGRVKKTIQEARIEVGEQMVPALDAAAQRLIAEDGLVSAFEKVGKWIGENQETVRDFMVNVSELVIALTNLAAIASKPFIFTFNAVSNPGRFFEWLDEVLPGGRPSNVLQRGGGQRALSMGAEHDRQQRDKVIAENMAKYGKPYPSLLDLENERTAGHAVLPTLTITANRKKAMPVDPKVVAEQKELMEDLNRELAELSKDRADDELLKLKKLEDAFKKVYGSAIPQAAREGFSKLRTSLAQGSALQGRKTEFDMMSGALDSPRKLQALRQFVEQITKERDALDETSKVRAGYNELLKDAQEKYNDVYESLQKMSPETLNKWEQFDAKVKDILDNGYMIVSMFGVDLPIEFRHLESVLTGVFYGFGDAAHSVFNMIWDDAARTQSVFEALAGGIAGSLLGGLAQYANAKVAENVALGVEELAKGFAALANPLLAPTAPLHFKAAAGFGVSAAKWAVLAGASASAQGAIGGGGSRGGGVPSGASDVGGRLSETGRGPMVVIYIDGIDPNNPRHQRLVGQTVAEYGSRGGRVEQRSRGK